ncbi:MAG: hypothetical protein HZB59_07400 [Ignavibacteriales bacterium]|nr:hypothetical protein [Ignavibacteriales bacterium]
MTEKNKYDEQFEKGKENAKKDDGLSHWIHDNFSKPLSSTKEEKSYDAGYEKGEEEKSGGCFITSACIEAKGLPDNCPELETLRRFRDTYVVHLPNGSELISEYKRIAPQIVSIINRSQNASSIYNFLFDNLVVSSVSLIHSGKERQAFDNIFRIVSSLNTELLS